MTQIAIVAWIFLQQHNQSMLSKMPHWYSFMQSEIVAKSWGEMWRFIHILLKQNNRWCSAKRKNLCEKVWQYFVNSRFTRTPKIMNFCKDERQKNSFYVEKGSGSMDDSFHALNLRIGLDKLTSEEKSWSGYDENPSCLLLVSAIRNAFHRLAI